MPTSTWGLRRSSRSSTSGGSSIGSFRRRRQRTSESSLMILSRLRTITVRIGRVARDAWLIVGITLALILGLEAAYRVQGAVRGMLSPIVWRAETAPPSPLTRLDWWADYGRDHRAEKDLKWTSYVYVRNPTFVGTHITVDSAGHRVTPQPEGTGDRTIEVFFLGGSTTFGWFQRQAFTIPALAAQRLSSALEPGSRLQIGRASCRVRAELAGSDGPGLEH